nr:activated cdc42 kinase 1 [Hymenolepis microstoma]
MSSSNWLRKFLDEVQLPDFYDAFRDVLQVTQLQHFSYVRSADLHRIGLSAPAIARIKAALKIHRENAGIPHNPRKKFHGFSFGIPLIDLIRYGPPRDAPILTPGSDSGYIRRCYSDTASPTPSSTSDSHLPCQLIRQEDVTLHEVNRGRLGSGSFGVVRRGDWKTPTGQVLPVALKILRRSKTDDAADFFSTVLSEVMLMQSVSHPNLVRIYGIIPFNPLVIVTELAPLGSLLTALRIHSHRLSTWSMLEGSDSGSSRPPATAFSVDILWDMSTQLARGMAHLASCCLIHRDLAARNVLLFGAGSSSIKGDDRQHRVGGFVVKIGDFGLLRKGIVNSSEEAAGSCSNADGKDDQRIPGYVYIGVGKQKIPFAWSPPEAIKARLFSQASDVWSWGVTVWEMWSGGAEPWPGLGSDAILSELKSGRRLAWPRTACPRSLYQLLLATWRFEPAQRPSFEYLVDRMDKIRPSEVVATQSFDEADRMDVIAGDRILVIDGRAANFWWRGQNRRTGEIASFPREIVRLQRNLQSQDISRPIENSFVHVGHHGFEGRAWGHVDRIDPAFLSGVALHHADTLSHAYARQPLTPSATLNSQSSWRPLGDTASSGNGSGTTPSLAGFVDDSELDKDAPRVDIYDEFEDEDERRLLDSSSNGVIGRQRLRPLSGNSPAIVSKLTKDLEASLRYDAYQYYMLSSSVPTPVSAASSSRQVLSSSSPSRSRSSNKTKGTVHGDGGSDWSASAPSQTSTPSGASHVPLIDFDRSAESSADRFPIPSAPIYQSHQTTPARNPYFQAAWKAWMHQSGSPIPPSPHPMTPTSSTNSVHPGPEDVEHIRRLFDATTVANPPHMLPLQQCEREVLVGASTPSNPFLTTPQSSVLSDPPSSQSVDFQRASHLPGSFNFKAYNTTTFDNSEVEMVAKRLPGGCTLAEAREALNCAINSPTARDIIHLHTPPPFADVLAPGARDWRVKVALRLLLLRRLVRLQLCTDLETCWSALEKADWSVEKAVDFLIYG